MMAWTTKPRRSEDLWAQVGRSRPRPRPLMRELSCKAESVPKAYCKPVCEVVYVGIGLEPSDEAGRQAAELLRCLEL